MSERLDLVRPPIVDPHVRRAMDAILRAPEERWSVQALARTAGLSRAAFARRFTLATGLSPERWLVAHRMRLAAWMLVRSNAPHTLVSTEVGYACEFAFSRAFKRVIGLAPSSVRRTGAFPCGSRPTPAPPAYSTQTP